MWIKTPKGMVNLDQVYRIEIGHTVGVGHSVIATRTSGQVERITAPVLHDDATTKRQYAELEALLGAEIDMTTIGQPSPTPITLPDKPAAVTEVPDAPIQIPLFPKSLPVEADTPPEILPGPETNPIPQTTEPDAWTRRKPGRPKKNA